MTAAMISVSSLRKTYGKVVAVREASFQAQRGAITTLLGGNGSGKTTVLRALLGLIGMDGGEIRVGGIDPRARPQAARALTGYFPDRNGLYPRLSPYQHWHYFGGLHGMAADERHARIAELSTLLGMESLLHRPTLGFSTGQRMLVALGRALVHRPQVLVLDEPSRGLDIENLRRLRSILLDLRSRGVAILMASHVLQEVDALSDHIVVMAQGRVLGAGSPLVLKRQCATQDLEQVYLQIAGAHA
ncbi:MAG: ATP-binding cassette domain-containing protein [Rhodanobacteraceae bacterium]|nr:ATP-binding cassette domain-containing protein [Rhodanobacteraceae bacterium]